MKGYRLAAALIVVIMLPTAAEAQDQRNFCPDRPGLGTPACTLDDGQLAIELGVMDWTLDRQADNRTDTVVTGDVLLRYGLTGDLEAQLGWSMFGHARARSGGREEKSSGTGDILLAIRHNMRNPDGSGFALAVMPYVTLPAGGSAIGAGDWGAGLLVPISRELPAGFQLGFTGSVEAAVDEDRNGRHLAYGAIIGLDVPLSEAVGTTIEFSARRNDDPSGAAIELLAGLSMAWSPDAPLQFDVGANFGLNRNTPDVQLYLGIARRF